MARVVGQVDLAGSGVGARRKGWQMSDSVVSAVVGALVGFAAGAILTAAVEIYRTRQATETLAAQHEYESSLRREQREHEARVLSS